MQGFRINSMLLTMVSTQASRLNVEFLLPFRTLPRTKSSTPRHMLRSRTPPASYVTLRAGTRSRAPLLAARLTRLAIPSKQRSASDTWLAISGTTTARASRSSRPVGVPESASRTTTARGRHVRRRRSRSPTRAPRTRAPRTRERRSQRLCAATSRACRSPSCASSAERKASRRSSTRSTRSKTATAKCSVRCCASTRVLSAAPPARTCALCICTPALYASLDLLTRTYWLLVIQSSLLAVWCSAFTQ